MKDHHWKTDEQEKIDFGKLSVEEQIRISKEMMTNSSSDTPLNEEIGREAKKALQEEQVKWVQ